MDNEMPFKRDAILNYLQLPEKDPGHQAALAWLKARHGAQATTKDITEQDRKDFLAHVTDRYYRIVSTAIKKYDPNHCFLGSRFHGAELNYPEVFKAAGAYVDVMAVNYYRTWTPVPAANIPEALPGDGAFAASGTCLVVQGSRHAWFGTGGSARARVFRSTDQGLTWAVADTPIMAGNASSGVFSLAFSDPDHGIAVGGDYRLERESGDNLAITIDGGKTWTFPGAMRLRSFRSAVAFVPGSKGQRLLAAGPGGTDISDDGGHTWTPIGDEGFHALSIAPAGGGVWAVGEQGRIGRLH